jgi:hypothetical protein
MNHHNIHYKCKLCGRDGIAKASIDCPQDQIDILAKALCCDMCYDAREKRLKTEKQIFDACHFLKPEIIQCFSEDRASSIRTKCRAALDRAVPAFCEAVCAGYRLQTVFEAAFVNDFYQRPEKAGSLMGMYKHKISELVAQPEPQI